MRRFYKIISLLLALSLWQFFVPVLNVAMELPCCEDQSISTGGRQCCETEFPSRMVCCIDNPAHAMEKSAPVQATLEKPSQVHIDLVAPTQIFDAAFFFSSAKGVDEDFNSLNHHFTNNHRYKLLATFLI